MGFSSQEYCTGGSCHALLQGIFLIQGSNIWLLRLLHWQADSLPLSHQGSHVPFFHKDPNVGAFASGSWQSWALLCYLNWRVWHLVLFALGRQFSSVAQWCPTLYDHMDCSTLGFPVYYQLLELTQTHVHHVSNAIQPSHPLSSRSPSFNVSQHQGLFQWVSSSH